ncbi:MAG: Cytochrome c-554 [Phycisphaerae bacterium]|nr:Cytochrome c-554 [Phycisphaerae bacterium]
MNHKQLLGGMVLGLVLVAGVLVVTGPTWTAYAQDAGAAADKYGYEGNKSCKKCHSATYKSWEGSKHATALNTLKPGEAKEAKEKFKLDPAKDYTTDETCLKCHTVGLGHKGGYAIPDAADAKAVKEAEKLAGVGCESCHGPSEEYAKVFAEIMKSKRMYKTEELTAVGLVVPTEATCTTCHNDQSPTHDPAKKFDFEEMKKAGVHEHEALKQREG